MDKAPLHHPNERDAKTPALPIVQHHTYTTCTHAQHPMSTGRGPSAHRDARRPPSHPNGWHGPKPNAPPVRTRDTQRPLALPIPMGATVQRAARRPTRHACDVCLRDKLVQLDFSTSPLSWLADTFPESFKHPAWRCRPKSASLDCPKALRTSHQVRTLADHPEMADRLGSEQRVWNAGLSRSCEADFSP